MQCPLGAGFSLACEFGRGGSSIDVILTRVLLQDTGNCERTIAAKAVYLGNAALLVTGGLMLISNAREFVFVHVQKTAGTSMVATLAPYANPVIRSKSGSLLRALGLPRDYRRYKFREHASILDARRRMPRELFDAYFKFGFVRNPWDRLVSEYNAALKKHRNRRHRRIANLGDFEAFIRHEIARGRFFQDRMLCDENGRILVDFVGRFERLEADYGEICRRLNIEAPLTVRNAFDHRHYREYYSKRTQQLVEHAWAREIELFEYKF